jgi:RimJ/RimL family protein N-acetyltransferase
MPSPKPVNPFLLHVQSSARLRFREIQESDAPLWLPFFENAANFAHWNEVVSDPVHACREWYEKQRHRYTQGLGGMHALFEKSSGRFIGHAGLLIQTVDEQHELEIAYSLLPEFAGKGYATEAAAVCRDVAFEKRLAPSVISIISITNLASQRVAIKNGLTLERETIYKKNRVYIFRITRPH